MNFKITFHVAGSLSPMWQCEFAEVVVKSDADNYLDYGQQYIRNLSESNLNVDF